MNEMNELYYQDAYLREFDAVVTACTPIKNGYAVELSKTAFYPEGGGQPGDRGTLNDIAVSDTHSKDGRILHYTAQPVAEGTAVHGVIDWDRRFDHMQQHSGEHIFSGLIHKLFGYENIGFHLGEQTVTLDFSGPLTEDDLRQVEYLANERIWRNTETVITYPSEEELHSLEFRSKKELHGTVRIVTFPDADVCACCGTHVMRSGEIGLIKVISSQNRKNGTRVDIVCGKRALEYVRDICGENTKISHLLSANAKETSAAVERTLNELGTLRGAVHQTAMRALNAKKDQLEDGAPLAVLFTEGIDTRDLRTFANTILEEKKIGVCAVFSRQNDSMQYVILSSSKDLRPIGKALNQRFSGRGGGPAEMIQGALSGSEDEIRSFLETLI